MLGLRPMHSRFMVLRVGGIYSEESFLPTNACVIGFQSFVPAITYTIGFRFLVLISFLVLLVRAGSQCVS